MTAWARFHGLKFDWTHLCSASNKFERYVQEKWNSIIFHWLEGDEKCLLHHVQVQHRWSFLTNCLHWAQTLKKEVHSIAAGNDLLADPGNNVCRQQAEAHTTRIHLTGGNRSGLTGYRSNRSGPVPVWAGTKPVQIQNLNLNSKKWKILKKFLKILQGTTNLMVSNFLKNSFI